MHTTDISTPKLRVVRLNDVRSAKRVAAAHDVADAWEAYKAAGETHITKHTKRTVSVYRTAVRWATVREPLPRHPAAVDVEFWQNALLRRGLSARTVNLYLRALRTIASSVRAHRLSDELEDVALLPEAAPQRRCPPADALWRVLDALDETAPAGRTLEMRAAERAFILTLATTACRVGEVMGFLPGDYDRARHELHVQRTRGSATRKNGRGKAVTPHVVRLGPMTWAALEYVIAHRDKIRTWRGGREAACEQYVYPWGWSYVHALMRRIRRGLDADAEQYFPAGTAWHAFRHLAATDEAERTRGDAVAVQALLGERSMTNALRYVAGVRSGTTAEAEARERRLMEALRQREMMATTMTTKLSSSQDTRSDAQGRGNKEENHV